MTSTEIGLTFIIGAARSGKSAYAVELATKLGAPTLYVATAEAIDPEMRARIRRHRADRPRTWRTLEAPLEFAHRIASEAGPGSTVIIDCLTVWLGNLLEQHVHDANAPKESEIERARRQALEELELVCRLHGARQLQLLVISNEVGAGLVPPYPLGRIYRDLLGEINQLAARCADTVLLLVAGLPLELKTPTQEQGIIEP